MTLNQHPYRDQTISFQIDRETKETARFLAKKSNRSLSSSHPEPKLHFHDLRLLICCHIGEYESLYGPIRIKQQASTKG